MCSEAKRRGNPIRGRWNAAFLSVLDGSIDQLLGPKKTQIFQDLPKTIVELGPGVGANFRYFPEGTTVIAVEPNPHMHKGLRRQAAKHDIELQIVDNGAEAIDLPDDSVEAVVCTLVLCSVDDPRRCLREVRRILKPGGRFYFLEHVAAPKGHWRRKLQDRIYRPWRYVFEGCRTNQHTADLVRAAGFITVDIQEYTLSGPFLPVNTQVMGIAVA